MGGSIYQVPIEIKFAQRKTLVICWLLGASRKHPCWNIAFKLSYELMDVARDNGNAIGRKEETHKWLKPTKLLHIFIN